MNWNMNSNFDKLNSNFWTGKKKYQYVCIVMAFVIAFAIMSVLNPRIGSLATSYVVIAVACPLGYIGFYNKNGLDFASYLKIKKSNVKNGKLTYRTRMVQGNSSVAVMRKNNKYRGKRRR